MGILDYQTSFPPLTATLSEEKIPRSRIHERLVSRPWTLVTKNDFRRLPPVQQGKWHAYEHPSKEIRAAQRLTQRRILEKKQQMTEQQRLLQVDSEEKEKHNHIIGELKAAEARNRLRLMRTTFLRRRAEDIDQLISCQPSALQAVRLQAILPAKLEPLVGEDDLEPLDRKRVESLVEDVEGLLTERRLT